MELMGRLLAWGIGFLALLSLVLVCWWALVLLSAPYRRRREALVRNKFLHSVLWVYFSGDEEAAGADFFVRRGRRVVAECIADLADSTVGLDPEPIRRIVRELGLEEFLWRRVRWSRSYRRAYYLQLLSKIPVGVRSYREAARYLHDRNRHVRFCAMSVRLAFEAEEQRFSALEDYSDNISYFELAELVMRLRHRGLPVDYQALFASPNRNLQKLAMGVVWHYGLTDAEDELVKILSKENPEESAGVLYILCALRCSVAREEVARFISEMKPDWRKALLRYMARQGYSVHALRVFIPDDERDYYVSLVDSYKLNVG
ncbi:MAG: hypothetical protein K2O63_05455 [Alistipes sp.]|nr:hypothetical protein [Alistipes sp.]MDE7069945.1 hypothetical protein [Alistipes sp.]